MGLDKLVAAAICGFAKLATGVRAVWRGGPPHGGQCVYFANHTSHGDFVLIWASLSPRLREITRPVAGADYWLKGGLRRYIATRVFRGVLIDRSAARRDHNPVQQMAEALGTGASLILFPEGTRNPGEGLLPFRSGIYHLAKAHPEVPLVPVWIENIGRVMPKGAVIPVPLLCTLTFGQPLALQAGEAKDDFLGRARDALLALAPAAD